MTGERQADVTTDQKVPSQFAETGDIVDAVIIEVIANSDNSNLQSAVAPTETVTAAVRLVVDPLQDSEVAEGSTKLMLIVRRLKQIGLTCKLGSVWAVVMVEVSLAASYCCSVNSYLRL